jgi:hypothetical protein
MVHSHAESFVLPTTGALLLVAPFVNIKLGSLADLV